MANSAQYSGISPEVYQALKSKLSGFGINLQGTNGKVSEKGVTAEYNFDEANQTLAINNVDVSFPASMMFSPDKVLGMITEAVTKAGGQQNA
ncbi:hypothetical protein I5M27_08275 [Adhaeribacter sp. BT258]|uniref:Uncharacterized protein n=1 Tax=Adhaeribacter terrigena TaxID=2793070 RepID=A0ABS1C1D5_9BACT|nr:hypothetical protein [Adhaeribacter terrigena]MBK0402981.1 hypothetical protein [Adhaeribacter terrigena]